LGRGSLAAAALSGDYGKPRPVLIIQSDAYAASTSVVVLPLTSDTSGERGPRIDIEPSPLNGLRQVSRVMLDKPGTIARSKLGEPFGRLSDAEMADVDRALATFLGLG
jgi:mRNA interferase MazF